MFKGLAVGLVLIALFLQLILSLPFKSPTADEYTHHIPAGYSYLKTGDFRLEPGSPSLTRLISAIPLAMIGTNLPENWYGNDVVKYSKRFWELNDISKTAYYARLPFILISLLFGYSLYSWCKKLWGYPAGFIALILYSFCPDILAHSGLATADMTLTFFFFLTITRFYDYVKYHNNAGSIDNLLLTGLCAGLTLLSKYSGIILVLVLPLIYVFSGNKRMKYKEWVIISIIAFMTVWAGYFFEVKPLMTNTPDPMKKEAVYRKVGGEPLVWFAKNVPVPCSTYISGFTSMMFNRAGHRNSFFMGKWSENGFPLYYVGGFLMKNSPTLLILFSMGIFVIIACPMDRLLKATLCVPIATMFLITLGDKCQVGMRYMLPVMPFVIAIAAYIGDGFIRLKQHVALVLLLLFNVVEAIIWFPKHLSYFSPLSHTLSESIVSDNFRYMRDSNIDWGQDLVKLKGMKDIVLDYFWLCPPEYYNITYRKPQMSEFTVHDNEIYAISLQVIDKYQWVNLYHPTQDLGGMYIYDFKNEIPRKRFGERYYMDKIETENGTFKPLYI